MKKIMQINITCGVGSTGKIAEALYKKTIENGLEASFSYSAFNPTIQGAFSIETKFQNYLRRGLNRYFGRKQNHSTMGTKRLIKHIEKEKPDLIHIHNVQQNSTNYIHLFAYLKAKNYPVVFTLHDCWGFTGGCFHFTTMNCSGYTHNCVDCPLHTSPDDITMTPQESYERKAMLIGGNDNFHVVCVSDWLKSVAVCSYMKNMKNAPIRIYNGIDTGVFRPINDGSLSSKLNIHKGQFVVLGVASYWTKEKGLDNFLTLARELGTNYRVVLVGSVAESDKFPFITYIAKTENKNELASIYSIANVFINMSREETFGMTTAEAMACGTPCIVFNSTACPEIVDDLTGIRINDSDELLDAVKKVCSLGKAYYFENCCSRAKTLFSEERMTEQYFQLYEKILCE